MRVLNLGSLNTDHVYEVERLVRPGETISGKSYRKFCGGKGLNQSIALARAGAEVSHAGRIGADGVWLKEKLAESGVDVSLVEMDGGTGGHAIIQVAADGENSIILFGGANRGITGRQAELAVSKFNPGDFLLLQNETSGICEAMNAAAAHGMKTFFNPAPMGQEVRKLPLHLVGCLIVNEVEGAELSGCDSGEPDAILGELSESFPRTAILLTLGSKGAVYAEGGRRIETPACKVKALDTTAAGDTFIGYFLAGLASGSPVGAALKDACKAAALCVSRQGAADSIPWRKELKG